MTKKSSQRILLLWVVVPIVVAANFADADDKKSNSRTPSTWDDEIAELEAKQRQSPGDLDIQLLLALHLSWKGELDRAYRLAQDVVRRAPEYRDAKLLLARIDGWRGDFEAARKRLRSLLVEKADRETRVLLADIELWASNGEAAELILEPLTIARENDAHLLYRLALAAKLQQKIWKARRLADEAVNVDPNYEPAKRLRDEIVRLRGDVTSDFEFIESVDPSVRRAHGVTATATGFVTSLLSVTGQYEYRSRFNTLNHRFALRSDWRFGKEWAIMGYLRTGVVEVLPVWTSQAQIEYVPRGYAFRALYQFDKLPWPGQLHRLRLAADIGFTENIVGLAAVDSGVLINCSAINPARAIHGGGRWQGRPGYVQGMYTYGVELERPPLPGFAQGLFGTDVCDERVAQQFPGINLSLIDTTVHQGALIGIWNLGPRFFVRAGYSVQFRGEAGQVHSAVLGVNVSY